MDTLKISSTGRGLNYLPLFHAEATGAFEALGLRVVASVRDPWTGVLDDLASGAADVVLGGLWVPAMYARSDRELTAIGQINARFPMLVLTREPVTVGFDWSWLAGKTVLVPGIGGTAPYEFPAGLMREAGADAPGVRYVRDLSGGMLTDLWHTGLGDAYITDTLTGLTLSHAGAAHVAFRIAPAGGAMPNSVFYVRRSRIPELRDRLERFMAVIDAAMRGITAGDDLDAAHATSVAGWPDTDPALLRAGIDEFVSNGTWSSCRIDPGASERWTGILHDAGLLAAPVTHSEIVDDSIVIAVAGLRTA